MSPSVLLSQSTPQQTGPRVARLHQQQKRNERLNYAAIGLVALLVIYVLMTIVRPIFFGHRPGQKNQDLGCVSKSGAGDC